MTILSVVIWTLAARLWIPKLRQGWDAAVETCKREGRWYPGK